MNQLTKNSKIEGSEIWYFLYQALAESTHGKLMHILMSNDAEAQTYRHSLMCMIVMGNNVLKNTDFHLRNATRKEVVEALQKAEHVVKKAS